MDSRLFNIPLRPGTPRTQDLPLLARAIVALFKGGAKVKTGWVKNLGYVRIETRDFQVQLLAKDWSKILPFIQDGSFEETVTKAQMDALYLDPTLVNDNSLVDRNNLQYYLKILYTLQSLFMESYPTPQE